jgi:hypothetical protein
MNCIGRTIASAALLAGAGCFGSSYSYLHDSNPEIEQSRQDYVDSNPDTHYKTDILAGRVRRGMTRLQVRVTWGDPELVTYKIPGGEIWSYSENEPSRGNSVYNLVFDGEQLHAVEVRHDDRSLNPDQPPQPGSDLPAIRTTTGKQPDPRF